MNQQAMPQKMMVRRENLQILNCSNPDCDSTFFTQIFEIGIWLGLINPTGQDQIINLPKMVCIKCGAPPDFKRQRKVKKDEIKADNPETNINLS